jgi:hypothetical protein
MDEEVLKLSGSFRKSSQAQPLHGLPPAGADVSDDSFAEVSSVSVDDSPDEWGSSAVASCDTGGEDWEVRSAALVCRRRAFARTLSEVFWYPHRPTPRHLHARLKAVAETPRFSAARASGWCLREARSWCVTTMGSGGLK